MSPLREAMNRALFIVCFGLAGGFGAISLMIGCGSPAPIRQPVSVEVEVESMKDHGGNIYYIPHNGEEFAKRLAVFRASHPELRVISVVGNGTGRQGNSYNGFDVGYWVICENVDNSPLKVK